MTQITEGAPVIEDGLRAVIQDEMQANNGWLPVRIAAVNSAPSGSVRSVDVEPLIRAVIDGEPTALPRAFDVPIAWESANGGASAITFPLAEGDYGRIQPAGGDISAWLANGTEQASDIEQGSFDLSDSIFKPDLRPFVALLQASAFSGTDIVISGPVQVGSNAATEFVALASKVLSELKSIKSAFDAHVHPDPVSGNTGTPISAIPEPGSVACARLRSL